MMTAVFNLWTVWGLLDLPFLRYLVDFPLDAQLRPA